MSRIRAAYTAHAALKVPVAGYNKKGVKIYDVDKIPSLADALRNTPCIVPVFGNEAESETPNTTAGSGDVTYTANFLALIMKAGFERGLYMIAPLVVDVVEAYCRTLADDDDLNKTLSVEAAVRLRPTIRQVDKEDWFVIEITHTWQFYLSHDDK